jgi:hypothetical protein
MKFDLTTRMMHNVVITDLEVVPDSDKEFYANYRVEPVATLADERTIKDEFTDLNISAFEQEWLSMVTRTAIDLLGMHDRLSVEPGEYFYLGRWTDELRNNRVAIAGLEMETYQSDITYNGWRVRVMVNETDWTVDCDVREFHTRIVHK